MSPHLSQLSPSSFRFLPPTSHFPPLVSVFALSPFSCVYILPTSLQFSTASSHLSPCVFPHLPTCYCFPPAVFICFLLGCNCFPCDQTCFLLSRFETLVSVSSTCLPIVSNAMPWQYDSRKQQTSLALVQGKTHPAS